MGNLRYKGYVGSVEYSEPDECFVGRVLGLRRDGIIYEGDSVESLKKDFEEAVDQYLQECEENGTTPEISYSGKLVLRMPSSLHGEAVDKAASMGISLNEFINRAIKTAVS